MPGCARIQATSSFEQQRHEEHALARRRGARSRGPRRAACPPAVYSRRSTSSGSPCSHAAKPGEASRLLSGMRELEALLRREERSRGRARRRVERRLLDLADQRRRGRGRARRCQALIEQLGERGCARGSSADRRRRRAARAGPWPCSARARARARRRRAAPAAARRTTAAPRAAARRCCRACRSRLGGVAQARDALAVLAPSASPFLQRCGLCCRRTPPATAPPRAAVCGSTQGRKSSALQLREGQQQVAEVALRVDRDRPECRRSPPPRAARCRARSCRCRSCRR